jgi:cytochrome c-type biogenesis protein CcmH
VTEDPLERRVLEIANDLRCAVCQNQPVSESNAELARDMREIIREQLQQGKTRQEIIDYFVARYGDYVLLKPSIRGAGTVVWVAPVVLVIILLISALVYLRRRLQTPLPPPPRLSKADNTRIRKARAESGQKTQE